MTISGRSPRVPKPPGAFRAGDRRPQASNSAFTPLRISGVKVITMTVMTGARTDHIDYVLPAGAAGDLFAGAGTEQVGDDPDPHRVG